MQGMARNLGWDPAVRRTSVMQEFGLYPATRELSVAFKQGNNMRETTPPPRTIQTDVRIERLEAERLDGGYCNSQVKYVEGLNKGTRQDECYRE